MDYKEKYEHALNVCKWLLANNKISEIAATDMFRELIDDEKIRISLINKFKLLQDPKTHIDPTKWEGIDIFKIIAWLEKQGKNEEINEASYRAGIKRVLDNPESYGLEKQGEQKQHLELKAGHWYFCHQAYCERADILTVKEGETFKCEKDGIVKGLIIKEPEKYFREISTPADKVEPKFKVGDWVLVCDKTLCQIEKVTDLPGNHFQYWTTDGAWFGDGTEAHLWTIQDAKKGDILQANKCTLIFDSLAKDIDGNTVISSWYSCDTHTFYGMGPSQPDLWVTEGVVPATKKQRDLLFSKMKKAGYEWDAEKKELKKIEQEEDAELTDFESVLFSAFSDAWQEYLSGKEVNVAKWTREHSTELLEVARKPKFCHHEVDFSGCSEEYRKAYYDGWNNCNQQHAQLEVEQKPAWSEEDEMKLTEPLLFSCDGQGNTQIAPRINWLKSLKERMKGGESDGD